MAISTEGKFGILVGLIGLAGGGAVWVAPAHTEIGWLMIAVAVLGALALAFHHFSEKFARIWNPTHKQKMIALAGMLACGIGFFVFAAAFFWPAATPEITLKYLYDHDFGNFLTEDIDFNATVNVADRPVHFTFRARMIFDFEHRARWLYYYIPLDKNTFGISIWLLTHTDDVIIPKIDHDVSVTNGGMLGTGFLAGKDLTFSRRIYIYHEFILTDSEMAELQHEATGKNLDLVFRGIAYQQAMRSKKS